MAKKRKKLKKKPTFAPPLSRLDKWIYKIGYVVSGLLMMLTFVLYYSLFQKIAYSDPTVIASHERGTVIWILPLLMYIFLSALIWLINLHDMRQPIFGNPDVVYGRAPFQHIYPLFSKERKKRELRPSYKRYRKNNWLLWLGGFLLCLFLACFSLFGRVSLMQNGDITVYGVFNNEKRSYSVADVAELEIKAGKKSSGKGGTYWSTWLVFEMEDGRRYSFSPDFEDRLKMKTLVDSRKIVIEGKENLDKVIEDQQYTPEELALLYELFEIKENLELIEE